MDHLVRPSFSSGPCGSILCLEGHTENSRQLFVLGLVDRSCDRQHVFDLLSLAGT